MRLIDADALYEKVAEWEAQALHMVDMTMHDEDNAEWKRWSTILTERSAFKFDVADAPTIDAVPVVRCADCKWFQCNMRPDGYLPNGVDEYECRHCCGGRDPTDFCSYGERKDGAGDGC